PLCARFLSTYFSPFIFQHTPPPQLYPLSLHDALPISGATRGPCSPAAAPGRKPARDALAPPAQPGVQLHHEGNGRSVVSPPPARSEEHTSELQSRGHLVCRLLLEKKKRRLAR